MRVTFDQACALHAIEQSHNIALGHQEPVSQLLLQDVGAMLELGEHIKLRPGTI